MGQKAQLWWDLPAADCFLLLQEIYQVPKVEFDRRLGFLAATLGVESQLKVQVRRLSLGERMKMELIAALLHEPRVVFLDEPTIGLDLTAQRAIREFLLEYRREHQPAMLLTSHYMEDIEKLCERIVIIREGDFVYDGPLSKIVRDYARHKVLALTLAQPDPTASVPAEFGELASNKDGVLRIKVLRENVPQAASELLRRYPAKDLSIEEEDIGTIIEAMFRKGSRA